MTTMQSGAPRHTGLLDRIGEVADVLAKDAPECDELAAKDEMGQLFGRSGHCRSQ